MLKNNQKISRKKEFDQIFKNGKSAYDKYFLVKILKNNQGQNRYSIIISTKVSKKAVERNKIKRRIKSIFLKLEKKLELGYDVIVVCKKEILDIEYKEINNRMEKIFSKLKLLNEK